MQGAGDISEICFAAVNTTNPNMTSTPKLADNKLMTALGEAKAALDKHIALDSKHPVLAKLSAAFKDGMLKPAEISAKLAGLIGPDDVNAELVLLGLGHCKEELSHAAWTDLVRIIKTARAAIA